jgi:hypothetical protein
VSVRRRDRLEHLLLHLCSAAALELEMGRAIGNRESGIRNRESGIRVGSAVSCLLIPDSRLLIPASYQKSTVR